MSLLPLLLVCLRDQVMAELFGKKTGCCRGQGGSMHIFSQKHNVLGGYAFIGEGIPIGLGAAFQSAYRCVGVCGCVDRMGKSKAVCVLTFVDVWRKAGEAAEDTDTSGTGQACRDRYKWVWRGAGQGCGADGNYGWQQLAGVVESKLAADSRGLPEERQREVPLSSCRQL